MPPEIIPEIYVHLSHILQHENSLSTLASLAATSREMYDLLNPILYKHVTLTEHNANGVFWGLLPHVPDNGQTENVGQGKTISSEVRREWSLWPDVAIPDEDEVASTHSKKMGDDNHIYPNASTNRRKLLSLQHIAHLTLSSLPSLPNSTHLHNLFPTTVPGKLNKIIPNISVLHVTSTFTYELSEWFNKHTTTPRRENIIRLPFLNFILLCLLNPQEQIIIDYPTYTTAMKERFIQTRYGEESVLRRLEISHENRRRKLELEWERFKKHNASLGIIPLPWYWRSTNMVLRNVRGSSLPSVRCRGVEVFFARVQPEDDPDDELEDEEANVVTLERRIEQIVDLLQPKSQQLQAAARQVKSWRFIYAEVGDGREVEQGVRDRLDGIDSGRVSFHS
ncbi:hypothetical protein I302_104987 [Kwoniella bestiolae CBS 10118]|uniref:F-box domain-containing protein n=1 Tax=Kwoniella bestiolae CBS 10118 TaxID=1296100 RepID=A0A1B9FR66_9TREE|nr:hypothetical protein I302_08941 [Kwoniella bestiolae CBS 10118]OCF21269.1 hypothetical protein I302_08941 [Kwoniella bestiolae CBS 10118]